MKVRYEDIRFLSTRLKALRKQTDLTQASFAEYIGMDYKFYQSIEAGRHWNMRQETIIWLAAAYHLSLSEFYAEEVPKTPLRWSKSLGVPERRY